MQLSSCSRTPSIPFFSFSSSTISKTISKLSANLTVDLPASLRLLRRQPVLSSPHSSCLFPLPTHFLFPGIILFPLLVWRFCLFVCCCCLHVWLRHSSLASYKKFHTRVKRLSLSYSLSSPYTPSSTTHGEFDRFAFFFSFLILFICATVYPPDYFSYFFFSSGIFVSL